MLIHFCNIEKLIDWRVMCTIMIAYDYIAWAVYNWLGNISISRTELIESEISNINVSYIYFQLYQLSSLVKYIT